MGMGQSPTKAFRAPSWPHRLPRGWLGPPCPLGGPSQDPHQPAAPPLPHPPQAQGTRGRLGLPSVLRDSPHLSFALGEPGGTSPPAWSRSGSRVGGVAGPPGRLAAGDSAETGAISRRLRGRPLPPRWVTKTRTQTSGAGRGGARREGGTHSGETPGVAPPC